MVAFLLMGLLLALPACGESEKREEVLKGYVRATDRLAFRFTFTEERPGEVDFDTFRLKKSTSSAVQGLVEDDFRFKAQVSLNEKPALEKIVADDALAVRFLDPSAITRFIDRSQVGQVDTKTDREGIDVVDALKSQRWVLDPAGAPNQLQGGTADRRLGADPVVESLTVFDYVLQAIDEALGVEEWSADSINPTYRTSEDPFPKPAEGSGVTRFDLRRPKLPPAGAAVGGGTPTFPQTKHFRKMAIYVKKGRVIQVREAVEVTGRSVKEFITYNRTLAKESGATKKDLEGFDDLLKGKSENDVGALLLAIYSSNARQFGGDPVNMRRMTLDLRDLGEPNEVALPTDDVITGNLAILLGSGQKAETADSGATTTTTTAPVGTITSPTSPASSTTVAGG
ncbi:MAG TPA: hypothetical protein VM030_04830 [Acidimicrobiales bacterium]|nr:hypothetical protein [Acidimicrobiales bacterium]